MINGFEMFKQCACGGITTQKFWQLSNKKNQYHVYVKKGQVKIIIDNKSKGVFPLNKLAEKLAEYGI